MRIKSKQILVVSTVLVSGCYDFRVPKNSKDADIYEDVGTNQRTESNSFDGGYSKVKNDAGANIIIGGNGGTGGSGGSGGSTVLNTTAGTGGFRWVDEFGGRGGSTIDNGEDGGAAGQAGNTTHPNSCTLAGDCKSHDCANSSCISGSCRYTAKTRATNPDPTYSTDGTIVTATDWNIQDYVVYGDALFLIPDANELNAYYGGQGKVQVRSSFDRYSMKCPLAGTLIQERGSSRIFVSDGSVSSDIVNSPLYGSQLKLISNPDDIEIYCGGSDSIKVAPTGSLTTTTNKPPAGLCPINLSN